MKKVIIKVFNEAFEPLIKALYYYIVFWQKVIYYLQKKIKSWRKLLKKRTFTAIQRKSRRERRRKLLRKGKRMQFLACLKCILYGICRNFQKVTIEKEIGKGLKKPKEEISGLVSNAYYMEGDANSVSQAPLNCKVDIPFC